MRRLTNDEFIERAMVVHSNLYDYSKVDYKKSSEKVIIICSEHGEFLQTPNGHLSGKGCHKCSGFLKTTEDIVKDFTKIHGERYNYDKVDYKGVMIPVVITCPEHGDFEQLPTNHLQNKGCYKCAGKFLSNDEFIKECQKVHNYKYSYDKTNFVKSDKKIIITCPKHGDFEQISRNHKMGSGCLLCANELSNYEKYKNKRTTLYYIKILNYYKIGLTQSSVYDRYKNIEFEIIYEEVFEDGFEAYIKEQTILDNTKEFMIDKSLSPIDGGWTEVRSKNILDLIKN